MCEERKAAFVKKVEHYNNVTFGIPPRIFKAIGCHLAKKEPPLAMTYAAYLYDSVMLYAKALSHLTSRINGEFFISKTNNHFFTSKLICLCHFCRYIF